MEHHDVFVEPAEQGQDPQNFDSRKAGASEMPESQEQQMNRQGQRERRQGTHTVHPEEENQMNPGKTIQNSTVGLLNNLSSLLNGLSLSMMKQKEESTSANHSADDPPSRERDERRPSVYSASPTSPRDERSDVVVIVYDLETTGLGKTETIGICELGCVAVVYTGDEEWIVIDSYHSYVMPSQSISKDVPNNISKPYLQKQRAKPFSHACSKEFTAFVAKHSCVKPVILCAHNGKRYDHRILAHHNWGYNCRAADSLEWFKTTSPGRNSYSLKNLHTELYGTGVPAAHNAMPDVHAVVRIMNSLNVKPQDCLRLSEHWQCVEARVNNK